MRHDEILSVTCQSNGTAAVTTPETPPMTNRTMKPRANSIGVLNTGRPVQTVAIHATTATALGMVIRLLAPL